MGHVFYRQPKQDYPVAVRDEGIEIIDRAGKRYLDASGGAAVSCLGHSHPRVIEAIQAQAARLAYAHSSFSRTCRPKRSPIIPSSAPEGINRVSYTSGGSEAVEVAHQNRKARCMAESLVTETGPEPAGVSVNARKGRQ